jgi:hypothetical protein
LQQKNWRLPASETWNSTACKVRISTVKMEVIEEFQHRHVEISSSIGDFTIRKTIHFRSPFLVKFPTFPHLCCYPTYLSYCLRIFASCAT